MKRIFFLLFAGMLYGILELSAQPYAIEGRVQNTALQPLHQATVQLQFISSKKASQMTSTDSLGQFRFSLVDTGKYRLIATYSGYGPQVSDTILLREGLPISKYNFTLQKESNHLADVTVRAATPPVQVESGKLIFDLQKQAVTAGQTAFDVLKKLPGIGIDQNENILFRGTVGVNVLVDGKMTYLNGAALTNYLKGVLAEDINKIELIATPGAELDAAGNAGIIQIITKRKKTQGYAVDFRSVVSRAKYWMNNQNITASLRTKTVSLYSSFDYDTPHRFYDKVSGNTLPGSGGSQYLQRTQQTIFKIKYTTWRTGLDWQLHSRHQLSIRYHGYFDNFKGQHLSLVNTIAEPTGTVNSFIHSDNTLIEPYHYDAISGSYRFAIDSLGKKITVDADYTAYRNYSDGLLITQNYTAGGSFVGENHLQVHQPGFIHIKSIKSAIALPYKSVTLAVGMKYAEVQNDNR